MVALRQQAHLVEEDILMNRENGDQKGVEERVLPIRSWMA